MKLSPIVFLDVDGVLAYPGCSDQPDPSCIARLDRLLVRTKARIMLTATWRDRYGLAGTEQRLVDAGFCGRLTGAIPRLPGRSHSEEVQAYLNTISRAVRFVLLDSADVSPDLRPYHVQVDERLGLTADDVLRAERILDGTRRAAPPSSTGNARSFSDR